MIAEGEAIRLRPAMDTLGFYLEWRVHPDEGRVAFQRLAVAIDRGIPAMTRQTLIRALVWQASFLRQSGQPDAALELLDRAEALCVHPDIQTSRHSNSRWRSSTTSEGYCLNDARMIRALDCFRRSVEVWEAYGDPWWVALGLGGLGFNLSWSTHFIEAREELSKSVDIFERYSHVHDWFSCTIACPIPANSKGIWMPAVHADRALVLAEQSGNRRGQPDALHNLATLVCLDGDLQGAEAFQPKNDSTLSITGRPD